jgi:hypothetical protein
VAGPRETIEHEEEETMAAERYAGEAGERQRREDENKASGAVQVEARAARRDLITRLPYGRALDMDDLASKLDQASTDNKSIVFRQRVLEEWRKQVPAGVVLRPDELERLRADSEADPKQLGDGPGIAGWPATR